MVNARLKCWASYLQLCNFSIRYIRGCNNVGADLLSHLNLGCNTRESEEKSDLAIFCSVKDGSEESGVEAC